MAICNRRRWAAVLALTAFAASMAQAQEPPCGSGAQSAICFGAIEVPDDQHATFSLAARQTVDAVHSREFAEDLRDFAARYGADGDHAAAWAGVDPVATIAALQAGVPGQKVATYGGLRGWFLRAFFGNVAYDGSADGPILLNRAALPRSAPSIANTFAHEIAHRAGLRHPHSSRNLATARCEPPYVIGTLVEKHAAGPDWRPDSDDCHLLRS
jgi:hypothetical protein